MLAMISSTVPETRRDEKPARLPSKLPKTVTTVSIAFPIICHNSHFLDTPGREVGEGADFIRNPAVWNRGSISDPGLEEGKRRRGEEGKKEGKISASSIRATRFDTHTPFNRSQFISRSRWWCLVILEINQQ